MPLRISFTDKARAWLEKRGSPEVVVDLLYKKGTCSGAFCRMIPDIEAYAGSRKGRYPFVPVEAEGGRTVHVAKPLVEASEERDVEVVMDRTLFRRLKVQGVDPFELGL